MLLAKLLSALLLPATLLFGGPSDLDANDGPVEQGTTQPNPNVTPAGEQGGVSTRDRYNPNVCPDVNESCAVSRHGNPNVTPPGESGGVSTRPGGPRH